MRYASSLSPLLGTGVPRWRLRMLVVAAAALMLAGCSVAESDIEDESPSETATPGVSSTATGTPTGAGGWWRPSGDATWQWQLQGAINTGYDVDVYDVDLFDTDVALIEDLQSAGRRVVCYFSAGSAEDWRPDFDQFDAGDVGEPLDGWEGERWVDIRSVEVHAIMKARLDLAASKGCDGVEPDNVASFDDDTGFDLTADDQLLYNRLIASEAHARDLTVGLKNDGLQIRELVGSYDFALNEECHEYDECGDYAPFIEAGKPVFNAEYRSSLNDAQALANQICDGAADGGLRTLVLPLDLDDSFRVSCDEQ